MCASTGLLLGSRALSIPQKSVLTLRSSLSVSRHTGCEHICVCNGNRNTFSPYLCSSSCCATESDLALPELEELWWGAGMAGRMWGPQEGRAMGLSHPEKGQHQTLRPGWHPGSLRVSGWRGRDWGPARPVVTAGTFIIEARVIVAPDHRRAAPAVSPVPPSLANLPSDTEERVCLLLACPYLAA